MNTKCKLKCEVCNDQFDCELHMSKDGILLYTILHQVQLGVQNYFCAPSIWIQQNQYSDISFLYMLSNLGNTKRKAAFPEEGIPQKI